MTIPDNITIIIDMEPPDILMRLGNEADDLHDGISDSTLDELADLFGESAEEIQRLRKELAEALYRNQEADAELARLRQVYEAEVDEFNAGCAGYEAGLSDKDEPGYAKHDQWRVGWAWAKFNAEGKP